MNSMTKVTIEQLKCNRCNHKWWPRISIEGKTVIPKTCASVKCKSPYWNKPRVFKKREKI